MLGLFTCGANANIDKQTNTLAAHIQLGNIEACNAELHGKKGGFIHTHLYTNTQGFFFYVLRMILGIDATQAHEIT